MIQMNVERDYTAARKELFRLIDFAKNPAAMLRIVGRRGANELKSWFRRRNTTPNKLGGRRTNYWRRVADSVQNPVLEDARTVAIAINDPTFAQHLFGGTITAKIAGALTVPVAPEAHGRTVRVFEQETGIQLFRIKARDGGLSNVLLGQFGPHDIRAVYLLKSSVTQAPDPQALPPRERFTAALLETASAAAARQTQTNPTT